MTQNEAILAHLKRKPITQIDALLLYGCFRLASRINELRECGYNIETRTKRTTTGKQIAEYHMKGE